MCLWCLLAGAMLLQLKRVRPAANKRLSKCQRTVSRAYGGSRCASCVRDR